MIRRILGGAALLAVAGVLLGDAPYDAPPGKRVLLAPLSVRIQSTTVLGLDGQGNLTYTAPPQFTTNAAGIAINLTAGTGNGTGAGGAINLTAGIGGATSGSNGGAVSINAGAGSATAGTNGGALTVAAGNINTGGGSTGGAATFQAGSGGSSGGQGGNATFAAGDATNSAATAGAATFRGGDGAGQGGSVTLRGGNGTAGNAGSGSVTISTATAQGNGASGAITVSTGNAPGASSPGGISFTTGSNTAGLGYNISGAPFSVTTGAGGINNGNGGDMTFTLGAKAGTGRPGQFKIANGFAYDQPTTLSIATATFTPDGTSNHYNITLVHASCPCTLANPSVTPVAGTSGQIIINQSATGSDTIGTWGSDYVAAGGTSSLTLSTGANAIDVLSYYVIDSSHIAVSLLTNFSH